MLIAKEREEKSLLESKQNELQELRRQMPKQDSGKFWENADISSANTSALITEENYYVKNNEPLENMKESLFLLAIVLIVLATVIKL